MNRIFQEGWAAAIAAVVLVVVGLAIGWIWAVLALGAACLVMCFVVGDVSEASRPAVTPKPQTPPPCGGIAGGCPVCLALSVAAGVVVGDWLSGDLEIAVSEGLG